MATSQELLQALTNMQQNAQSNLPVIPNNGNPRGANNMPGMEQSEIMRGPTTPLNQGGHFYPWMNPSPSVNIIQQLLAKTGGPNQPTPALTASTGGGGQMLPVGTPSTANTGGIIPPPVLPQIPTGIMPPGSPRLPGFSGLFGNQGSDYGTRNGQALTYGNGQGAVNQNAMQFRTVLPRAMQR